MLNAVKAPVTTGRLSLCTYRVGQAVPLNGVIKFVGVPRLASADAAGNLPLPAREKRAKNKMRLVVPTVSAMPVDEQMTLSSTELPADARMALDAVEVDTGVDWGNKPLTLDRQRTANREPYGAIYLPTWTLWNAYPRSHDDVAYAWFLEWHDDHWVELQWVVPDTSVDQDMYQSARCFVRSKVY